jgi:hypothetical protein
MKETFTGLPPLEEVRDTDATVVSAPSMLITPVEVLIATPPAGADDETVLVLLFAIGLAPLASMVLAIWFACAVVIVVVIASTPPELINPKFKMFPTFRLPVVLTVPTKLEVPVTVKFVETVAFLAIVTFPEVSTVNATPDPPLYPNTSLRLGAGAMDMAYGSVPIMMLPPAELS